MFLPVESTGKPKYRPPFAKRWQLHGHVLPILLFALLASCVLLAGCSRENNETPNQAQQPNTGEVSQAQQPQAVPDSLVLRRQANRESLAATLDSLNKKITSLQKELFPDGKSSSKNAEPISDELSNIGLKLVNTAIVLAITHFLIRFLVWILASIAEQSATRRLFFKKLIPVVRIVLWSIAVYYVVGVVFSFDKESLIVAGGAIGVAIGFAAQDIIKNIFGGILIILDQPFQVGDRVRVGGTYGEVVSIGLRSTRIVTPDDNLVTVPNTQVVDGQVANANSGALDCQVVTELYLPGWVDVSRAKEIAHSAAATSRYVYLNKPIVVLIKDEFEHAFLTKVVVKAYVLDARYENLFASDVTERAKTEFLKEGLLQPMYLTYFDRGDAIQPTDPIGPAIDE